MWPVQDSDTLEETMETENLWKPDGRQSQGDSCCASTYWSSCCYAGRELWLLTVLPSSAAFCQRWESSSSAQTLTHGRFSSMCVFIHNLPNSTFAWTKLNWLWPHPGSFLQALKMPGYKSPRIASVSIIKIASYQAKLMNWKLWCWE